MTRYGSASQSRNGASAPSRSSSVRRIRNCDASVIWGDVSRLTKSPVQMLSSSRLMPSLMSMPVVPVQRVVASLPGVVGGIVELGGLGARDDPGRGPLAEVDARLGDDRRARLRDDRQVADDEVRQAVGLHRVDGHHRHAVAVGVHEVRVQPVVDGRVPVERHLAPGQHHLALLAIDEVAVDVHVHEVVVLADRLELVQRRAQRSVVPQAGVGEGVRIVDERLRGQDVGGRIRVARSSRPGRRRAAWPRCRWR